jgi:hypothetical protein
MDALLSQTIHTNFLGILHAVFMHAPLRLDSPSGGSKLYITIKKDHESPRWNAVARTVVVHERETMPVP